VLLDRVNRSDGFSIKKPFLSSARGASFHTKQASNVNVVRLVLLVANSYLAYRVFVIFITFTLEKEYFIDYQWLGYKGSCGTPPASYRLI
jgi:hypothetical protein